MNKLNKILLLLAGAVLLSCGGSGNEDEENNNNNSIYGGVFTMPIGSYFTCIRPVELQKLEIAKIGQV